MALISVIVPMFNAADTLAETIESIRAQTWTRWEAILVDGGSDDGTFAIAAKLAAEEPRIRLARSPRPGPSAARNHGAMDLARGDLLAFCDADDLWQPNKLGDVADAVLGGLADAAFGRVGVFHDVPEDILHWSNVAPGLTTVPVLLTDNPVGPLSNLSVSRAVFAELGGLREDMVQGAELEFMIRLAGEGFCLRGLEADHLRYRLRPNGLSADTDAVRKGRLMALRTALRMHCVPTASGEALSLREMAHRALASELPARDVRRLVSEGCSMDARAFLLPARRGVFLALAAWMLPALPRWLKRSMMPW